MTTEFNNSNSQNLELLRVQEQQELLNAREGKYKNQPSKIDLAIFVALLFIEGATVFSLVFNDSKDFLRSLSAACFPVAVTVGASSYQANKYSVKEEQEKLRQEYQAYLIQSENSKNLE